MTNIQIIFNVIQVLNLVVNAVLAFTIWRIKKKVLGLEDATTEIDELVGQHETIIDELIKDQEAMEEPLQKSIVLAHLAIERCDVLAEVIQNPLTERKSTKSN